MILQRRPSLSATFVYGGMIVILLIAFFLCQSALNDRAIDHDEEYEYSRFLDRQSPWQILIEDYELGLHVLAAIWAKSSIMLLGNTLFSLRWPSV